MAYEEIVGQEWGNPHPYMSSMWDVFVPNPRGKKELQQNIYGAGYQGADITNVTEGRSPFGALIQGIGLIGEPDPRPLTYYEQFLYEQGKHQRSEQDLQTEKQRLGNYQEAVDLMQDVIEGGGDPSEVEEFLQYLPKNMRGGFERAAQERSEDVEYLRDKQFMDIEGSKKDLQYKDWLMQGGGRSGYSAHIAKLNAIRKSATPSLYEKLYKDKLKQAIENPDPNTRALLLNQAGEAYKFWVASLRVAAQLMGGDDTVVLQIAGENPGAASQSSYGEAPNPVEDERLINQPQGVDKYLDDQGYPIAAPTNQPTPMNMGQPTPTPQGLGGAMYGQ